MVLWWSIFLSCWHIYLTKLIVLPLHSFSVNEYYTTRWARCIYSSPDLSDMEYIDSYYFNKYLFTEFNSTLGRFVGFGEYGMKNAELWNNSTFLQRERANVDAGCRFNIRTKETAVRFKTRKRLKTLFWSLLLFVEFNIYVIFTWAYILIIYGKRL